MSQPRLFGQRRRIGRRVGIRLFAGFAALGLVAATAPLLQAGSLSTSALRSPRSARKQASANPPADPLVTVAIRRFLATRSGTVSVAIEDLHAPLAHRSRAGAAFQEWFLNPGARFQTASIVKLDILETLLHHAAGPLTGTAASVATGMIEDSDNDDATDLWNLAGGAAGVTAYNQLAGLRGTEPNAEGYWGETLTSVADQIRLLQQLAMPSKILSTAAREYALGLMERIEDGQNWGVTGGVPNGVTVALKNGWVPLAGDADWEVNSVGWVHGDGRDYLISVLTSHDPSEQYGIGTIQRISSLVFAKLRA